MQIRTIKLFSEIGDLLGGFGGVEKGEIEWLGLEDGLLKCTYPLFCRF